MPQTYKEVEPSEEDTLWERLSKFYVRICSIGDEIYSAGSGVGTLHKQAVDFKARLDTLEARINTWEKPVADLRMEFDSIKAALLKRDAKMREAAAKCPN